MLFVKSIVSAVTLASTAHAFFPYMPEWRCTLDKDCSPAKRSTESSDAQPPLTMRVVQRTPESNLAKDVHIKDLANRLKKKYSGRHSIRTGEFDKRANAYKVVPPAIPSQPNSVGVYQDGTDYSYFVQASLGSDGTPVYFLLDTGAGTSWVMGPSCNTDSCRNHNSFGGANSKTFKDLNIPFSIHYGSGNVNGTMGEDTIAMAGFKITTSLGIAAYASDDFNHFPIDGILGLSLAKGNTPHFWESLAASRALKANLFGLHINRNADGPNDGVITFGDVDTTRFTGDIKYYPIAGNTESDWALALGNVGIGNSQAGVTGRVAYIDTGTSFIFGPPEDVKKLHALVPGASSSDGSTWTVPCDTKSSASVTFGTDTYNISPKDWVSPVVDGVCTSNIYGVSVVDEKSWLIGDTFLKNVYSVFDYDKTRLGFAAKASESPTTSSASASSTGQLTPSSIASESTSTPAPIPPTSTAPNTGSTAGPLPLETQSNASSTDFSGTTTATQSGSTASVSETSATSPTSQDGGVNGHQTPSDTGTAVTPAAAESSSTDTPKKSGVARSIADLPSTIFAVGAVFVMLLV
ncbi:hypothetical protein HYALB_00006297 [Hymenoscyphus albidus]|uniref:Peptidase A1 domain-containing protein n=1 Tax=Hymenoscyphus albidus TaxID=595503 RepID=A0A9N9Q2U3_9HELO|nr:hypothetical protein HYALB_00006297 [Hymenoscyphus albidus]